MSGVYYHFTADRLRDGRPLPPVGEWLVHEDELVPCASGLHASAHPFDALGYAPGALLHRVELGGEMIPHGDPVDKVVARRRRILNTVNATEICRAFSRRVALDVVHLWDCPKVVRRFLESGDESLRDAAWDTAWAAARAAATAAARAAARDAARAAARDAATDAAWAAATDAAWAAATAAARAAARAAATDAAWAKYRSWLMESAMDAFESRGVR